MQVPSGRLTHNGVLYLSLGFRQEYLLQVLTLSQHQQDLQLVLYDGLAYIGALFRPASGRNSVRELDVVRVTPLLARPNEPIVLQRLEVVQAGIPEVLGQEVISLDELMRRREFSRRPFVPQEREDEGLSPHSRKIAKLMEQGSEEKQPAGESSIKAELSMQVGAGSGGSFEVIVLDEIDEVRERERPEEKMVIQSSSEAPQEERTNLTNQQPQIPHQVAQITQNNVQTIIEIPNQDQRHEPQQKPSQSIKEKPIIRNNPAQSNTISLLPHQQPMTMTIDVDSDSELNITFPPSQPPTSRSNPPSSDTPLRISDLYERMPRFRILCRVNHLSYFISNKGTHCTKMQLIDESGDEITGMLFQKAPPNQPNAQPSRPLTKGKSYIFQNGEISKDAEGVLSLSVSLSNIIEQHLFMPSFVPSKMMRLGDLQKQESSDYYIQRAINLQKPPPRKTSLQPINVCGIYLGFKQQPKATKNHFRVVGVLCDPDLEISIHFSLLVDGLLTLPEEGATVSLHRVTVVQDERTLQLQGGKEAYILDETGNTHEYFADLLKSTAKKDWRYHQYKNLSLVTYTSRNINELQSLLSKLTTSQSIFSQIDCTIANMRQRRSYEACLTCKREVKADSQFGYCFSCKKITRHGPRFMFDLELSDPTGCIKADLSSDLLSELIGITPEQYASNGGEEQRKFCLELWAYTGVLVKVKSERVVGGVVHKVVSASKTNHKRSLSQIRSMTIDEKTKYKDAWSQ